MVFETIVGPKGPAHTAKGIGKLFEEMPKKSHSSNYHK
jgi:hypothetical protein